MEIENNQDTMKDDDFEEFLGIETLSREREEAEAQGHEMREKIRAMFKGCPHGDEVAKFIIEGVCGCGRDIYTPDGMEMARRCGSQQIGYFLKNILEEEE